METAVATPFLGRIVPKLLAFLQENHNLRQNLEHDIESIRRELEMIAAAIEDHDRGLRSGAATGEVQRASIQEVRELAYVIEDCIDRFMHRVTRKPGGSSFRQTVRRLKTTATRTKFARKIRELRKKSEDAFRRRERYSGGGSGQSSTTGASGSTFPDEHRDAADIVGMNVPRDELLNLIRETEGQPEQLKVISIVGFGGSGKTLLAREVYDGDAVGRQYKPCAWVRAAEKDARDVLKEILQKLGMAVPGNGRCDVSELSTSLRKSLESKRFFIVIDDMQTEYWHKIKNAFPAVTGVSSRVIVTTTIQSIAHACSSFDGHVYVMRNLDEEHSRLLFCKEAYLKDPLDIELSSEALKKCDGLPLALVTTAQFLQSKANPTQTEWANLCDNLGEHLEKKETLDRMKRVLVQSYTSLPDQDLKACLLYLGIFPSGRPVRKQSLIRRWVAEGFVGEDYKRSALDVAIQKFKELVDRSIIQPIDVRNNTEVKTCQTHGMMLEFIRWKSMCENFSTLLYHQSSLPVKIRRLSLDHKSATMPMDPNTDLSLVRSLTVFGKMHKSVLKFSKFELLRVLDLEECDNLEDKHLKEICNLLMLKYLSLGGAVTLLPKRIARLEFLETLDVRRTKIKILPVEVIKLPCLIHLLGEFKLEDVGRKMRKVQKFLSEKSNLQTLSGFVADKSQEFSQLMDHMNNLTKVKIWCDSTADASSSSTLSKAIEGFIQKGTNVYDVRSLTLNFKEWSKDTLNFSLENSCYLSSLKLQGNICILPPFVTTLDGLTELCLSSPNQLSGDILAALSTVRSLHYLKLIASQLCKFKIPKSLLRLCIVVQSMDDLEIKEGALPRLESLRLLCEDLDGFCGVRMECLGRLKEVTLHDGVSDETKMVWKEAAKNHPKRPKVSFVRTKEVDQTQMGSEPMEISDSPDQTQMGSEPMEISDNPVDDVETQLNEGPVPSVLPAGKPGRLFVFLRPQPSYPVLEMGHGAISTGQQES